MGCILGRSEAGAASLCSWLSTAVLPAQHRCGSSSAPREQLGGLGVQTAPAGLSHGDEPLGTAWARPGSVGSQPAMAMPALWMHTRSPILSCSNPSYEPVSRPCNEHRCS